MNKICLYVVNDNSLYMNMVVNSIKMLRHYNQSLPVRVILVVGPDKTIDGSTAHNYLAEKVDGLNIEIVKKRPRQEESGFFLVNKVYMTEQPENSVLFLDSDTFVFGDVESLFDKYQADMTGCENTWVDDCNWDNQLLPMRPINSGVLLFHNSAHKKLTDLPKVCQELRTGDSLLANWIRNENRLHNREEMGFCLLAGKAGLTTAYFAREDAYNIRSNMELNEVAARRSTIFHSYAAQWKEIYNKISGTKKKMPRRLFQRS